MPGQAVRGFNVNLKKSGDTVPEADRTVAFSVVVSGGGAGLEVAGQRDGDHSG